MGTDNAYVELGLTPGASAPEVKAAWRRLASQWHPDRNRSAGAAGRMQRINLAFEALRRAGFPADAGEGAAPGAATGAAADTADTANPGPAPAADAASAADASAADEAVPPRRTVRRKVRLSLEEAALGCTRVLRGKERETCADCGGSGQLDPPPACPACGGTGQRKQAGWYGLFSSLQGCQDCHASGLAHQACAGCGGAGQRDSAGYRVTVRLPAGVRNGDELHVDARRMRAGQSPGDLLIRVELQAHPIFQLGDDGGLRCELPVNGFAWMAGRAVMVPTLAGLQSLALVRDQLDYRLPGEGFPARRGGPRGDLHLRVQPSFPSSLSTDQQILLDQLIVATAGDSPGAHPQLQAWQQTLRAWQRGRRQQDNDAA